MYDFSELGIDKEKAEEFTSWFITRIEDIDDGKIEEIYMSGENICLRTYTNGYDRHYDDPIIETFEIPLDIFFSNASIYDWMKSKKAEKREKARKEAERQKKAAKTRERNAKEKHDKDEYKRLKLKFENEENENE